MKKIIINIILVSTIFGILIGILAIKIGDNKIKKESYNTVKINLWDNGILEEEIIKEYPKEEILKTYKGYDVCAKLEIPSIPLQCYILSNYSKKALKVSCTKFWGVEPNEKGNFCIAGHNTNTFGKVKYLESGDTLYIIDNIVGRVEYEVFDIYQVSPNDVDCLDAITENKKEVTLITCTNDTTKRVIIKAKEK